ncbi:hypothetical protein FLJU110815_00395 [Flavobacterium jumunjinense]
MLLTILFFQETDKNHLLYYKLVLPLTIFKVTNSKEHEKNSYEPYRNSNFITY